MARGEWELKRPSPRLKSDSLVPRERSDYQQWLTIYIIAVPINLDAYHGVT